MGPFSAFIAKERQIFFSPLRITERVKFHSYVLVTGTDEEYRRGAERAKRKGIELHGGRDGVTLITARDRAMAWFPSCYTWGRRKCKTKTVPTINCNFMLLPRTITSINKRQKKVTWVNKTERNGSIHSSEVTQYIRKRQSQRESMHTSQSGIQVTAIWTQLLLK